MSATIIETQPGCGSANAPGLLTVDEARRRIFEAVQPIDTGERVPLRAALGRILAEDVVSPIDVPAHTNSAMDGYALAAHDLPKDAVQEFQVVGTALAGRPLPEPVRSGQVARIMTGAPLPHGTDTVVMQEQVERVGAKVRIGTGHRLGQNVRQAGEDLARGMVVLSAGKRIMPAELGLLASLGLAEVEVIQRPRVAFFSTGDELRSIGEPLGEGQVYDSNRYTLYGMLSRLGVELIDMGIVRDDRDALRAAFVEAADSADVVITSGGVSVGEADFVPDILRDLGQIDFWKIAIKPGRPLSFGRIRKAFFFGLPGNPVSVMVTFYQFVQPALRRLAGDNGAADGHAFKVPCASRFRKKPGRTEYQRAVLEVNAQNELMVRSTGQQGSGILRSMSLANCFVVLPANSSNAEPGTLVEVQPFDALV